MGAAHDIGFRTFQIALPPWGVLTDDECMTYFTDVCGSFPDSGFLHYNLPRPKRVLGTEDYKRLQDAVPNLVATKFTGAAPAECARLVKETELQHFLGENNFPFGCLHGECSLLASLGPMMPKRTLEYFGYGVEGDFENLFSHAGQDLGRAADDFLGPGAGPVDDRRGLRQDDRPGGRSGYAATDALALPRSGRRDLRKVLRGPDGEARGLAGVGGVNGMSSVRLPGGVVDVGRSNSYPRPVGTGFPRYDGGGGAGVLANNDVGVLATVSGPSASLGKTGGGLSAGLGYGTTMQEDPLPASYWSGSR